VFRMSKEELVVRLNATIAALENHPYRRSNKLLLFTDSGMISCNEAELRSTSELEGETSIPVQEIALSQDIDSGAADSNGWIEEEFLYCTDVKIRAHGGHTIRLPFLCVALQDVHAFSVGLEEQQ